MPALASSLLLAIGQLADTRILRILAKSVAVTLALFLLLATVGWYAFDALLGGAGLTDELFFGAGAVREAASVLLALLGLWLLWRIVAMAVIQFYADDVVEAVEARYYPAAQQSRRELPAGEQVGHALKSAARALVANLIALPFALILLFTGVGTAILFWLVNAVLIGRELQDMVWLKHRTDPASRAPIGHAQRFFLGGTTAALLIVPFANFLAPVLGAASATHLIHREMRNA